MKTEKVADLSRVISQNRPECQHFIEIWNSFGCTNYDWIKDKRLIKHQHCSQVFNSYLECVINHSHK